MNSLLEFKKAIEKYVLVRRESGVTIIHMEHTGTPSPWIFDFRALMLQPKWLNMYAEIFWEKYASRYPFQVGGMETASIALVTAIVMKGVERGTPVNGFYIRKSRKRQGLLKRVEGTLTEDPVILVDDALNSGGTIFTQVKILSSLGKKVRDVFAIIRFRPRDAYTIFSDHDIRFDSLFSIQDFGIPLLAGKTPDIPRESFYPAWHFTAPKPSLHIVAQKCEAILDDTRVFFGTDDGTLYALNQKDGSVLWTFKIDSHPMRKGILASPSIWKNVLYFGSHDGAIRALDAKTGRVLWTYSDADWVESTPALAPKIDALFIGIQFGLFSKKGGLLALSQSKGSRVWQHTFPAPIRNSPLYVHEENLVVVSDTTGMVYAYTATTGAFLWQYKAGADIPGSFAYDAKRRLILFGSMDSTFYALSAIDGSPIFGRQTGAGICSTPLVRNDTVYIASLDKHLYAFSLETGNELWKFKTSGRVFSSPAYIEESIWIGSNDGRLYELDPTKGTLRNFFQATERVLNKVTYNPRTKRFFITTVANEVYCLMRA